MIKEKIKTQTNTGRTDVNNKPIMLGDRLSILEIHEIGNVEVKDGDFVVSMEGGNGWYKFGDLYSGGELMVEIVNG